MTLHCLKLFKKVRLLILVGVSGSRCHCCLVGLGDQLHVEVPFSLYVLWLGLLLEACVKLVRRGTMGGSLPGEFQVLAPLLGAHAGRLVPLRRWLEASPCEWASVLLVDAEGDRDVITNASLLLLLPSGFGMGAAGEPVNGFATVDGRRLVVGDEVARVYLRLLQELLLAKVR